MIRKILILIEEFGYDTQTNVLVEFLKSRVPGMNIVNFFIR